MMFSDSGTTKTLYSTTSRLLEKIPESSLNSPDIYFTTLIDRATEILVVIDTQVEDTENLLNGVIPGAKVILLNATEDGVRQITQALQENSEISQLHIISHGSPGSLQLGNTQLSLDTLPLYANELQTWFKVPLTKGDLGRSLLLYGCNVAAGDAGTEFIEKLHQLTQAEIAASTTRTGDAALGGDWNLDVKTGDFDVVLALSQEVQANYQFVFPEPISDINAPDQPPNETVTRSGLSQNGSTPLTFNFGQGNNRVIVDFQDDAGDTFEAVEEDLLNTFALRRNNNTNPDGSINGRRQLVWFETEGPAANGELNLSPEFPGAEDLTLMEEALSGSIINRGTDNVFSNTGNGQGNNNNVERIDYYVSDGGTLSISVGSNPNDFGFLILERGGNDPFQIAAITAIDNVDEDGNPAPSAYGPLVSFLDIPDDLNDDSNPWGISNIALNTAVLQRPDREIVPNSPLRNTSIASGNVAGIFVSYEDLGIAAGETFFGYSLFPADIDDTFDLVDFESFPTDTPDDGEVDGGLDLIAGGVVFNRQGVNQPPIARDDIVVTEFNTPIDISVLDDNDNDDNNDSADSDPDNSPDPISIIEESITDPPNGSVAFNDNGTPDPSDDFITYTPNDGFVGDDRFEYAITDGQDNSQPATVTITVNPQPITTVSGNVFADSNGNNLDDANEDRLEAITVNLIDAGGVVDTVSVETSADGVYQFEDVVPGNYTIQVDTADTELPAGAILGTDNDIAVTVAGTPETNINFGFDIPPVANPDTATTPINTDVSFNVTTNDTDDGNIDPTTVDLDPADGQQTERTVDGVGTYSVDETTGEVTFVPEPGFTGESTINYTVQDNVGLLSAPAPITVTVNAPPTTTVSGNVFTDSDGSDDLDDGEAPLPTITVNLIDAGGNVVDTVETSADGTYQFDGVVPGDYTVQVDTADTELPPGAILGTDNDLAVTVDTNQPVTDINFGFDIPPIAVPDTVTTPSNTEVTLNVTDNDTDDGNIDPTTVDLDPADGQQTERTVDGVGTYSVDDTGVVTFTPEPGFTGESTINYTVQDNNGLLSAPAPITVTVNPPENTPPVAVPDTVTTQSNTPVPFNVTDNDTDDGDIDPTTVDLDPDTDGQQTERTVPGEGTYTVDDTGEVTFTPEPGFTGESTINYTVQDNSGLTSAPAPITVTVNAPETTTVSGSVFVDEDGSDTAAPNEPRLGGITVSLLNNLDGTPVLDENDEPITTETDQNGNYTFTNVPNGQYRIAVDTEDSDIPDGFTLGTPVEQPFEVAGEPVENIDFGFDPPPLGFPISGSVYSDFNGSDTFTPDEPRLPGITVNLLDSDGNLFRSTTTDENGNYVFNNVLDGQYTIQVDPEDEDIPDGFNLGTPNNLPVTVAGAFVGGQNFGFDPTANNLPVSGTVFTDVDTDGTPTPNEPRLDGITVNLLNPDQTPVLDGDGNPITTETDPNGNYVFDSVPPGDYLVQVDETDSDLPTGETLATPNNLPITVTTEPVGGINFGFDPAAVGNGVSGSVFTDENGDDTDTDEPPLAGISVNLLDSTGETVATTATNEEGNYTFNNIPDGDYTVTVDDNDSDVPPGFTLGTPNNLAVNVAGQPVGDNNFGFDPAPVGDPVSGTVFIDENGDDTDTDEPPLPGITVNLLSNGNIFATTSTDENGNYIFNNIPDGDYTIQVDEIDPDLPTDFSIGTENPLTVTVEGEPLGGQNFGFDPVPSNQPPEATDENLNTSFNTPVPFDLTDNVTDSDGTPDISTIDLDPTTPDSNEKQVVIPDEGTFTIDDAGQGSFEPVEGFSGTVTIPYTVRDNIGDLSNSANISVTVSPDSNQAPIADNVQNSSIFNNSSPVPLGLSPENFSDPDGTVVSINLNLPDPAQGSVLLDGTVVTDPDQVQGLTPDQLSNLTFEPNSTFTGIAAVSYTVTDNDGEGSNSADITFPINQVITTPQFPGGGGDNGGGQTPEPDNVPPTAENETGDIQNNGTPSSVPTLTATDPDGTINFFTITELPPNGTLFVNGEEITNLDQVQQLTPEEAGQLTFEPDPDFTGDVTFSYTATDDDGAASNTAVVRVTVEDDTSIPRGDVIDDGGCDCPPLPDFAGIPLPDRPDLIPSASDGIEDVLGTDESDILPGSLESDEIFAFAGDDVIEGFDGEDTVFGGVGNELVFGDEGNDVLFGDQGEDTVIGTNGSNDLTAVATEGEQDTMFGNQSNDLMQGGPGEDVVYSGKQDDFTYGGKQSDQLWGDEGSDTLYGDEGDDTMIGDTADENQIDSERGLLGMIDFMWGGSGDDFMNGGRSNDTLSGGVGNDTVRGGKEDDLIYGEAGDDLLYGDLGNDQLCGNEGNDTLYGGINDNTTPITTPERDTLCGGSGDDVILGNEDQDQLCGGADNDTLYGGFGEDTLAGEQGDDWLFGDQGADLISGGSGADRFVLFSQSGTDTIQDFQLGIDLIALGGGLSFDDLDLSQDGASTIVSLDGQQLAILNDIQVGTLTEDSFTTFGG